MNGGRYKKNTVKSGNKVYSPCLLIYYIHNCDVCESDMLGNPSEVELP